MPLSEERTFKTCSRCDYSWATRDAFMRDPRVECIGYQANFGELMAGLFLFNHSCMDTLGVEVSAFEDLYRGEVFEERLTGTEECPEFCLHEDELGRCPAKCECAFVREILQIIRGRGQCEAVGVMG